MNATATSMMITDSTWRRWTIVLLVGVFAVREAINALALAPVHFDEAQYWTYGEALAFSYYSKPPLAAWLIRLSTEIFGQNEFGLRAVVPLLHAWIGWLLFATGRRMFDAPTGFWAALVYTAAPGVVISSNIMSTDPVMMAGWAAALYSLVRALTEEEEGRTSLKWWALCGAAVGAGMMGKYTGVAFFATGLGYALFSRRGPMRWDGAFAALIAALLVLSPNLIWNAMNQFATIAHVGENAALGKNPITPGDFAEFLGAQFGVFGPVAFAALILMFFHKHTWIDEWRYRLLMWLSAPLVAVIALKALSGGANPNWAAPAYVGGSLMIAAWLLDLGRRRWLVVHGAIGAVVALAFLAVSALYADRAIALKRSYDPFKKSRPASEFCGHVINAMEETGIGVLVSNNRRRLAECMWHGGFGVERIAVWNPKGGARNHYEMVASLTQGDNREMLLILQSSKGGKIAKAFRESEFVAKGDDQTYADRAHAYQIWRVKGFMGYPDQPAPPPDASTGAMK